MSRRYGRRSCGWQGAGTLQGLIERTAGSRRMLALIWLVFLLPRAAMLLLIPAPWSDAEWYVSRAVLLAEGHGYIDHAGLPTAFWPPGWSWVLSLVFRVAGPSLPAMALFNLACAAATGWLLHDLTRRITGQDAAGRLALLLYAIYPNAVAYVPLGLTEVFYTLLLIAGCRLLIDEAALPKLVLAGGVFALATLVKTQTPVIVPLVFAVALARRADRARALPGTAARMALVLAVAALGVMPWSLRNHAIFDAWVPVSTNGGHTLLTGNNDSANGGYIPHDRLVDEHLAAGGDEVARDDRARRLALRWIAEHPGRFVALAPLKLYELWGSDGEAQWNYERGLAGYAAHEPAFRALRIANQLYYYLLLAGFAAAALVIPRRRRQAGRRIAGWWLLPYGIALYLSAIAVVFSGQSRFHFPVMPLVAMSCAMLIVPRGARGPTGDAADDSGREIG